LQGNRHSNSDFRQIQSQEFRRFLLSINHLGIIHGRLKSKSSDKPQLPWRPFKDRPTGIWIDETVQRKETAEPEGIEALFRNQIPKDAKFRTLKAPHHDRRQEAAEGRQRALPDVYPKPVPDRFPRLVSRPPVLRLHRQLLRQ
jgi:hypothetical protein